MARVMVYVLHYAPDNASQPVTIALEALGVAYDRRLVDRRRNAQTSEAYLSLNPHGRIPVLETPDGPIFETAACLLWLADRHGALAPAPDSPARAAFLKWLFFASNTLHADLLTAFYVHRYAPEHAADAVYAMTCARLSGHWSRVEHAAAAGSAGLDGPSILSFYLASLARWSALYPTDRSRDWFDLGSMPALFALFAALERCDSVAAVAEFEGLGDRPFTAPHHATPREGSAV